MVFGSVALSLLTINRDKANGTDNGVAAPGGPASPSRPGVNDPFRQSTASTTWGRPSSSRRGVIVAITDVVVVLWIVVQGLTARPLARRWLSIPGRSGS
jgi:hypothetical protein